ESARIGDDSRSGRSTATRHPPGPNPATSGLAQGSLAEPKRAASQTAAEGGSGGIEILRAHPTNSGNRIPLRRTIRALQRRKSRQATATPSCENLICYPNRNG